MTSSCTVSTMSDPLPLSASIITLNEEVNLRRCLESVKTLVEEIVVLDCGSTDGTEKVAREFGAHFEHAAWQGHVAQKNRALLRCTRPWVLSLDADEAVTAELALAIREALTDPNPRSAGFELNRRTWYLGDWIWYAWYPEWRLRLVRRETAKWVGLDPHDRLAVEGNISRLQGDLLHYSFRDLEDHLRRTIRYAKIAATAHAGQGRRFRWLQLLGSPWAAFFKHLILKRGFRDGWRGCLISGIRGIDAFAKHAFLLELERNPPPSSNTAGVDSN